MKFFRVGRSGLKLSEITYGTALTIGTESSSLEFAQTLINTAWEVGIRSFDVSNNYGMGEAERLTGRALKAYPREEYVITTKGSWPIGETVYHKGLSRKHVLWAFEESINRLGLDYVDIYYAHRYDPETPLDEVVRTFNYLINSGRVRYWATSEWPVEALCECLKVCADLQLEAPILDQFIYSYAVTKAERSGVVDFCREHKVGMLGFSPLCQGFLTGKYRAGIPAGSRIDKNRKIQYNKTILFYQQNQHRIDHFLLTCAEFGAPPVAIALQWCIRKGIYPVLGASRPQQLQECVADLAHQADEKIWEHLENI